ncbi:hypothetical protein K438DRAFT_1766751 [Mycena galopus ATCC 62051]|nr:hypothetical protein K438DRAFT_1766751 [Mycena galopus ATCC 62051]
MSRMAEIFSFELSTVKFNYIESTPLLLCFRYGFILPPARRFRRVRTDTPIPDTDTYPFPIQLITSRRVSPPSRMASVLRLSKTTDARVRTVSERAGFVRHFKVREVYYGTEENFCDANSPDLITDDALDLGHVNEDGKRPSAQDEMVRLGGILIQLEDDIDRRWRDRIALQCTVSPISRATTMFIRRTSCMAMRREWGTFTGMALFVEVPVFGQGVRTQSSLI